MPNVFIGIGMSGSGKSTFFKTMCPDAIYLNADSIRGELCNGDMSDQSRNREVFELLYERLEVYLEDVVETYDEWKDIIVDNTSLTVSDRNKIYKIIEESPVKSNWKVVLVYFKPDLNKAIEWNCNRERKVPLDVLYKQFNKIAPPTKEEMEKYKHITVTLG